MAIGRKVSPAKFIGLAIMGGIAVAKMIKARKAKKRALAEQKKAQAEMESVRKNLKLKILVIYMKTYVIHMKILVQKTYTKI